MENNALIILGAVAIAGLGFYIVEKGFLKIWPKSGKIGINTNEVQCPVCNEIHPKIRKPRNMRQFLWGGWTCSKCCTEMDKYGVEIRS